MHRSVILYYIIQVENLGLSQEFHYLGIKIIKKGRLMKQIKYWKPFRIIICSQFQSAKFEDFYMNNKINRNQVFKRCEDNIRRDRVGYQVVRSNIRKDTKRRNNVLGKVTKEWNTENSVGKENILWTRRSWDIRCRVKRGK